MALSSIKDAGASLAEKAAEQIVEYIRENKLQPGDRLPNEKELERKLNVSRSTIRAAMNSLKTRGVVDIRQGSGTFIAEMVGVGEDPLGLSFKYDHKKALTELLELRFILEPAIAGISAQRASKEDAKEIMHLADEVENAIIKGMDYTDFDAEFHYKIAKSTGNELVMVLIPEIVKGIKVLAVATHGRIAKQTIETHRKIAIAIRDKNAQAARDAATEHLRYNQTIIEEDQDKE
jgi:GntR family transcriptional repressor for pyruvate dehydrogenase complex